MITLPPELHDLAVALGILQESGEVSLAWFKDPLGQTRGMLDDPARRAALGDLIATLVPPDPVADDHDASETWHPLTAQDARQRVFLTRRPTAGGGLVLGLAARLTTATAPDDPGPHVSGTLALGLVEASDDGLRAVVGTPGSPVRASVDVVVDPSGAVGFEMVSLGASLTPADAGHPLDLRVTVHGLRRDGQVLGPVVLDPARLGADAVPLLQTLLQDLLSRVPTTPASPEIAAVAAHLLTVVGLGGDVPRLPVEHLGNGTAVVAGWFTAVLDTAGAAWVGHLAGLLGAAGPTGSGTESDPWRVQVADLGGGDHVELTLASRTGATGRDVLLGVTLRLHGPAGLALDVETVLVALPLTAGTTARAVPSAGVVIRAPADPAGRLVDTPTLRVDAARGGIRWDGTTVRPVLELDGVRLDGHTYASVDLSNVDSARAAAAEAVRAALADALGDAGPGARLAVLAGLLAPPDDPGAPVIDPVAFVAAPTRELARVHRARLTSADHPWSAMLGELAGLLGVADPVVGAGTATDPWRVPLVAAAPLTVELAAWTTEPTSDAPSLHLGARVVAGTVLGPASVAATVRADVLTVTLPAAQPAGTTLLSGLEASVAVTGPFAFAPSAGTGMGIDGADARLVWLPGGTPTLDVELTGLVVELDDERVTLPVLRLPPDVSLDASRPDLGLGVGVDQLDQLVRALLARAWGAVAGDGGRVLGGLLGLHADLADLPADWPGVRLPDGGLGELLADPLAALRVWLVDVALGVSADGSPYLLDLLSSLRQVLTPPDVAATVDTDQALEGSGTWAAPWRLPLAGSGTSQLLLWLEPDGPPAGWATAAADAASRSPSPRALVRSAGRFSDRVPGVAGLLAGPAGPARGDAVADALTSVTRALADGDGVVPLAAQLPDDPAWEGAATLVDAAHHRLPEHADAVAQVLGQVDSWVPGPARTVLLLGPPFADRASWAPLLAAAEAAQPGATAAAAHFDLRSAPAPELADLQAVTAVVSWYSADLDDPGGALDRVVAQVARVVDRVRALRDDARVVLVAHSTAGLAARAFTAANPDVVAGLITLGTPHGPAPLGVLDDAAEADALRFATRLLDAAQVTSPLHDATTHLLAVAEGWQRTANLPTPLAYPRDRFAGESDHGTGGTPALAIAGQLAGDPTEQLAAALGSALASGPAGSPTPTHLGIGVRVGRTQPVPDPGVPVVDAGFRVDVARVSLADDGAPVDPAAGPAGPPPTRLGVEIRVDAPDGFLLDPAGGRGVRVRRAELGVTVEAGPGAGPVRASAGFGDAGVDAPTVAAVTLEDPAADRLLAAVVAQLPTYGPTGRAVVDALVALDVASRDDAGVVRVLADAAEALRADAGAYLGARARAALDVAPALVGLAGRNGGPWTAIDPGPPLSLELDGGPDHDRLTVRLAALGVLGAELDAELTLTRSDPRPRTTFSVSGASTALRFDPVDGSLVLLVSDEDEPVQLLPRRDGADLAGRLARLLVARLVTTVLGAALLDRLGPGWQLGPLARLLRHPEELVMAPPAAGRPAQLDGDRLEALLEALAGALGQAAGTGLSLPGGLVLASSGRPARLTVRTDPPFGLPGPAGGPGGSVAVELDLTLADVTSLPAPAGTLMVDVPLGGTWGGVAATVGVDHGTVSLSLTPRTTGGPLAPIVLLPRFGGLGPLAADAASALLPAVLDGIVARLPDPRPPVAAAVLAVADALGVHGGAGDPTFAGHVPQLRALAQADGITAMSAAGLPATVVSLWPLAGLPGTATAVADGVSVRATFEGIAVAVEAGWGAAPLVRLRVDGLVAGPVALDPVVVGFAGGTVTGGLTATLALPPAAEQLLGLRLAPGLQVDVAGDLLSIRVLPLGAGTADLLAVELLPTVELRSGDGGVVGLLERVAVPLAAQAALDHADLDRPLFTGGPTPAAVLRTAGVLAAGSTRLVVPLPALEPLVLRTLGALVSTGAVIPLADDLTLRLVVDTSTSPARLGLGLHGATAVSGDSFSVSLRLGETAPTWIPDPAPALRLLVIEEDTWQVRPSLRLAPLGLRLAGSDGAALVDGDDLHLGAVTAYLWADLALDGGLTLDGVGGALDLDDLGLPLGAVTGSGDSSNPVAASLLSSGGSGGAADGAAVAPGLSLVAARRPASPFALLQREDDTWVPFAERPLWFGVHRTFGPIAVDQVGVAHLPAPAGSGRPGTVALLVDGGVAVGPLAIEAHGLGVGLPLDQLDQPASWRLDLAGLDVALRSSSVSMAGGLVKRAGPPVDYLGTVTVEVAGKTLTAVGAYARPTDELGGFTSLFVFVGIPAVLGGPPCLFVTGLGGGAGYNRRLVLPTEITDVPLFPLVTAIDDGVSADPMGSLVRMGDAMPPARGSLWLAAGIRFTSFSFVRSVAVVYVTLGRGVEVGLLGVARASIPPPDAGVGSLELAFVELALKARYSPAEGVLSVQAQLTDHSWLLSRDCQLTGGFAFVVWFRRAQFVLTLGGYHPAFVKPPEFPVVPRLGFHWAVSDAVVIKGESYFALTSSAVMAGGRLEVSFREGSVYASFVAYADFLIAWDPFHYDVGVGVSVTAGFRIKVCFFACVTIDVHLSLGASVHLVGPPLRGEATLDLEVCSVTVAFGHPPHDPPTFLGWDAFREKYVIAGADDAHALSLHAGAGLVPPEGGAPVVPPGSRDNPWRLAGTFALHSETRLAATGCSVNHTPMAVPLNDGVEPVPAALDLAPMNVAHVVSVHDLTVRSATSQAVLDADAMAQLTVEAVVGHAPAAVWRITGRPTAAAVVVPVVTGLSITGHPRVADDHGRPPLSAGLVDSNLEAVPIGLVEPPALDTVAAVAFHAAVAGLRATATGPQLTRVAADVLGPAGAAARVRAGLTTRPISALGVRALRHRRSSPPLVASLAAGAGAPDAAPSRRPAAAAGAASATVGGPVLGITAPGSLRPPLLLATLRLPPSVQTAVAPRTRISGAADRPRTPPPTAPLRPLHRATATGAAPTRAASTGRTLPPPSRGVSSSRLEPGDVAVWDVSPGNDVEWRVSGPGAARVVFLDRAGMPLLDQEVVSDDGAGTSFAAPAAASRVVVRALGRSTQPPTAGPGAVSLDAAPQGRPPVAGWQSGSLLAQVGPTVLLARAATVHLAVARPAARDGSDAPVLVLAGSAVARQPAVETWLPGAVDVVVVVVDATDAETDVALPGVTVDGAVMGGTPTVVAAGRRLYLMDEVVEREDRGLLAVRVVTGPAWQLAGVLGMPGTVAQWTPTLTAPGSDHLVSDGPVSASGAVTVRYRAAGRGAGSEEEA